MGRIQKKGMGRQDREKTSLCWWQHVVVSAQLHLKPYMRKWKHAFSKRGSTCLLHLRRCKSMISPTQERALGLYRHCCLLRINELVKGAWAETALSTQAFSILNQKKTFKYFTCEWVMLLPFKDTQQRNPLDSQFTHPKDAEPYPRKVGLTPDGCQTSVTAASLQLLSEGFHFGNRIIPLGMILIIEDIH